jgi:acyl-coenzyme A synthetase/AMP-(fatty) acid ligase
MSTTEVRDQRVRGGHLPARSDRNVAQAFLSTVARLDDEVALRDPARGTELRWNQWRDRVAATAAGAHVDRRGVIEPELLPEFGDLLTLIYTSGTTGPPKPMRSRRSIRTNLSSCAHIACNRSTVMGELAPAARILTPTKPECHRRCNLRHEARGVGHWF